MRVIFSVLCVMLLYSPVKAAGIFPETCDGRADGIRPTTPGRETRASFHPKPWSPPGRVHYDPVAPFQVSEWSALTI